MQKIYIITYEKDQCLILKSQMEEMFGQEVAVLGITVDECEVINFTDGIVVFSSPWVEVYAKEKIDKNLDYIVAERVINYNHIGKIMQLKEGEDVLVCSDAVDISQSVIRQLKEVGFKSINFIPYNKKIKSDENIKTAIAIGIHSPVPNHIEQVIDMGARMISIPSIVEILKRLDLVKEKENIILFQFVTSLMSVIGKYNDVSNQNEEIKSLYQTIVNNTSEGIIFADMSGNILVCNEIAKRYFNFNGTGVAATKIDSLNADLLNMQESDFEKQIITIHGLDVALTKICVKKNLQKFGYVYILEDIKKIITAERKIRLRNLQSEITAYYKFEDIIFRSFKMQKAIDKAKNFAMGEDTVLIEGESGTGKELFAQAIHNYSQRRKGPFVAINFAAMTESLLESELFGYDAGSFTGANKEGKRGLFERAHGGTIFIDEIGDASLTFQARILRVLQERQLRRVGSTEVIPIDIRVIAASNLNLWNEVSAGRFRKDLFFRLNVLPIFVPALRERTEDIPLLLEHYIRLINKDDSINLSDYFTESALGRLMGYGWPGNVRELVNVVKYSGFIKKNNVRIEADDLMLYSEIKAEGGHSENAAFLANSAIMWLLDKIEQNKGSGRRFLVLEATNDGMDLSEARIRNLTKKMELMGLLQLNPGGRGYVLTAKGKSFRTENNSKTKS